MYNLTFSNGAQLTNLRKTDGGNWLSETPIDKSILVHENLTKVIVTGEEEYTLLNQQCDFVDKYDDGYSFNLRDMTEMEKMKAENDMLTECILEMSEILYGE